MLDRPDNQHRGVTMSLTTFVLENAPELREAIVRHSVRDVVAAKIATLIASGILKIGDDLPSERDLAAALQVSRETVRGGIQILVGKGLLSVAQGARTKVVGDEVGTMLAGAREPRLINSYELEDIHTARWMVERQVVAASAERVDDEVSGCSRGVPARPAGGGRGSGTNS